MRKIFTLILAFLTSMAFSQSTTMVISQVYGAGGNTGATYNADYVELHNISTVAQSLSGLSVQYGSSAGTTYTAFALPAVSVPAGGYYLIQMSAVGANGSALTPDATAAPAIAMASASGKIILVNGLTAITSCTDPLIIDLIGYGSANCSETTPTGVLSSTTAALRNNNGCTETNNNSLDFTVGTPAPRNSASAVNICSGSTTPVVNAGLLNNFGSVTILTNSVAQTINVSGANLTGAPGNITATASSTDFQVSSDNTNWGGTANIAYATASLSATPLYVRFTPQSTGIITGTISISGGGISSPVVLTVLGNGATATALASDHLVISQVYGAGGNSGALFNADFVELHNRSSNAISLAGHSIQYSSATTTGSWSGKSLLPAVSIPAGGYYLIQMSPVGTIGAALPTPDNIASPAITMSQTNGRVALVSDTINVYGCPNTNNMVDLVGYGTSVCFETAATAALDTLNAALRNNNGCDETNNNLADFTIGTPAPRNSATAAYFCSTTQPAISASTLANFGNVVIMTASAAQTMTVSGANLTGAPGVITVTSSGTDFQVSTDNINWSSSVTIPYTSATLTATSIYVRFTPQSAGVLSGNITISGGGISSNMTVVVSGTGVTAATPTLTAGALNDFGSVTILTSSPAQSFSLAGTDLTGAPGFFTITAPSTDFEVSNDNATWGASTTIAYTSATLASTLVYVRFSPQTAGLKTGNISITGGGVASAVAVAVSGTGITGSVSGHLMISQVYGAGGNPGAVLNADYVELHNSSNVTQSLSGLSIQYGSATNANWTSVAALPAATIPPGGYFLIQTTGAGATGSALPTPDHVASPTISMSAKQGKVALVNGTTALVGCPTIGQVVDEVGYGVTQCSETAPTDTLGIIRAAFRNNNGCDDTDNNLGDFTIGTPAPRNSATPVYLCVPAGPNIACSALTAFGAVCVNSTTGPNSFTITGTNLNAGNITVAALNGYTYATTSAGPYSTSLSLTNAGGSFSQMVYVQFNPTTAGNYDGNITVDGGGITAPVQVAASGSASTNVPPVVTAGTATAVTTTGATVPGSITSVGCSAVTAYGIQYSTTANFTPGTGTNVAGTNLSSGSFSVALSSLQPGVTYYYITYATNSNGTAYSTATSFTTVALTPQLAASSLNAFGDVCLGDSSAAGIFNLTGSFLTTQAITVGPLVGFVFATDVNGPYSSTLVLNATAGSLNQTVFVKFAPTAAGQINSNIPVSGGGLSSTVYVAAAANGVSAPPSVETTAFADSDITGQTTANLSGRILDQGCSAVTERGIEYSGMNGFVNGQGMKVIASSGAGQDFTSSLSGLVPGATYYYKAYASSSNGTGYGNQQQFTMPSLYAGLTIYNNPIPQGGLLHYSYNPVQPGHYSVKIFNLIGQLVYQKDLIIQVSFINDEINLPSTLTPGRYVLQIDNDQFRRRKSFMIQ